jgi:hypothetical protein
MVLMGNASADELYNVSTNAFVHVHKPDVFKSLGAFKASEIRRRLQTYTKFFFVRHPLERLLSAYRNKFQTANVRYHINWGNKIARRLRKGPARPKRNDTPVDDITFAEFVRFNVEVPHGFDPHWRQITELCHPSVIKYDFIGRYENLEADANKVLKRIGVNFTFPRCQDVCDM